MTIDVKENMKETERTERSVYIGEHFVKVQSVDTDAAYQRLAITRKMLKEYKAAINATNTVDVVGEHKEITVAIATEALKTSPNLI